MLKQILNTLRYTYQGILYRTLFTFGKSFALRNGEYTSTSIYPTKRTLQWKDLQFTRKNKKHLYLSLELTHKGTKTNRTYKQEILTRRCICDTKGSLLCSIHWMLQYKKLYKQRFDYGPNAYVFINSDGSLVQNKELCTKLARALLKIGIKENQKQHYRPHSLRHGEATDLLAMQLPPWIIKKQLRHTRKSETTFRYCHLSGIEEANTIYNTAKNYKKIYQI